MSSAITFAIWLLDPRGRIDRRGLLAFAIILIGLEIVVFGSLFASGGALDSWPGLAIKALLIWIGLAATSKRLHDIGYSALWMLPALGALFVWTMGMVLSILFTFGVETMQPGGAGFFVAYGSAMLPAMGLALWLHLAPGAPATNRFGPVPESVAWGSAVRRADGMQAR